MSWNALIFLCSVAERTRNNDAPIAIAHLVIRSWHLILSFSNKRNQEFLKKWLILGLEQKIYKMTLRHCIVPKIKKVHTHTNTHRIMVCQRDTRPK